MWQSLPTMRSKRDKNEGEVTEEMNAKAVPETEKEAILSRECLPTASANLLQKTGRRDSPARGRAEQHKETPAGTRNV